MINDTIVVEYENKTEFYSFDGVLENILPYRCMNITKTIDNNYLCQKDKSTLLKLDKDLNILFQTAPFFTSFYSQYLLLFDSEGELMKDYSNDYHIYSTYIHGKRTFMTSYITISDNQSSYLYEMNAEGIITNKNVYNNIGSLSANTKKARINLIDSCFLYIIFYNFFLYV